MTSPRTVSRLSRILALIPYVLGRDGVDVSEIIARFDYSQDQLTRDLNTVFVCGLPGYGPGDLMEAYIDENEVIIDAADYFARAPRLTPTEALSLLAAGLAVVGSGQATPELESAVGKLSKAVIPDAETAISVDVAGESETLAALREAAAGQHIVRITYRSLGKERETVREVEPWSVFTTLGNWYLQGFCRLVEGERVFRIDRIRDLEQLDEAFMRPEDVPEPGVGYSPSDDDITCEIALMPPARWVPDYYPVEVLSDDGDVLTIRFSSPDAEVPARLLLRLGTNARLVSGPEVARRTESIGEELLTRYP